MRFKVGDKVRVREKRDLRQVTGTMDKQREQYAGEVLTITEILGSNYITEETEVWWKDEMLEPAEDSLVKKIEERNNKHTDVSTTDKVNSPSHYNNGSIEVIDMIEVIVQGYEPFEAYLVGNAIKYLARANFKGDKQTDLEKTQWHIDKLLKEQIK